MVIFPNTHVLFFYWTKRILVRLSHHRHIIYYVLLSIFYVMSIFERQIKTNQTGKLKFRIRIRWMRSPEACPGIDIINFYKRRFIDKYRIFYFFYYCYKHNKRKCLFGSIKKKKKQFSFNIFINNNRHNIKNVLCRCRTI